MNLDDKVTYKMPRNTGVNIFFYYIRRKIKVMIQEENNLIMQHNIKKYRNSFIEK